MADPISLVGAVVASAASIITTVQQLRDIVEYSRLRTVSNTKGVSNYLRYLSPNIVPQVEAMTKILSSESPDVALKFRDSYVFDCNMTAVAVS